MSEAISFHGVEKAAYSHESVERGGRLLKGVVAAVLSMIALAYGAHLFKNYKTINAQLYRDEHRHLRLFDDDHTVSRVGRIDSVNRNADLRAGKLTLFWTIETTDGKSWSCSYAGGFSNFKEGDPVRPIIHDNAEDENDYTAFMVGIKQEQIGATSEVWAQDAAELQGEAEANEE